MTYTKSDWPRYSDTRSCVKCDCRKVSTTYHDGRFPECTRECPGHHIDRPEPHMLRHCTNCHYEWVEHPLDSVALTQVADGQER